MSTEPMTHEEALVDLATENKRLRKALDDLRTAVAYKSPPIKFNGVLCYEARVPVEFIDAADVTLRLKD